MKSEHCQMDTWLSKPWFKTIIGVNYALIHTVYIILHLFTFQTPIFILICFL